MTWRTIFSRPFLLELNDGSDMVHPGQEMRVPRELILRGALGVGRLGDGHSHGYGHGYEHGYGSGSRGSGGNADGNNAVWRDDGRGQGKAWRTLARHVIGCL